MSQVRPTFDPNDPKYICCCGCHVMTGAKISASIVTVAVILNTLYVIILVYIATQSKFDDGYFYYQIGSLFVFIVVLCCLWYGLIKEREGWLLPMLIYMVINLVMAGVSVVIVVLFSLVTMNKYYAGGTGSTVVYFAIIVGLFALQCWFFDIIRTAYCYIKHKRWLPTEVTVYIQQSEQVYTATSKLLSMPSPNSNRNIIINALQYSVFAGAVHSDQKENVHAELAKSGSTHFLILFRDHLCQYRGLYTWDQMSDTVHRIHGIGPRACNADMMNVVFKYDCDGKAFTEIPTRHLSAAIDGFCIKDQYWQTAKIPHSGRTSQLDL